MVSIGRLPDKERRKVRRDYKKVQGERKFRKEPFFKRNRTDWNEDEQD